MYSLYYSNENLDGATYGFRDSFFNLKFVTYATKFKLRFIFLT